MAYDGVMQCPCDYSNIIEATSVIHTFLDAVWFNEHFDTIGLYVARMIKE